MESRSAFSSASLKVVLTGAVLCVLILIPFFFPSLWVALACVAAGAGGVAWLALAVSNANRSLMEGLNRVNEKKRDFLFDEVLSWKSLSPLGALVSEVVAFNMHRREFYRNAVQAVGTPFLLCDGKGTVTHVSDSMAALLKKSSRDIVGHSVGRAFYGKDDTTIIDETLRSKRKLAEEKICLWDGRTWTSFLCYCIVDTRASPWLGPVLTVLTLANEQRRQIRCRPRGNDGGPGSPDHELPSGWPRPRMSFRLADEHARARSIRKPGRNRGHAMEEMTATVMEVAQNASSTPEAPHSPTRRRGRVRKGVGGRAGIGEGGRIAGRLARS